jgi:thiol-disulfide isomerase/thioredoxin
MQTVSLETKPVGSQIAPQAAAQAGERPGELYQEAMKPLDVVRSSLDNWSDTELGALTQGMVMARTGCEHTTIEGMGNEDLYDLIRLCALGQDWIKTNAVALQYLATGDETHRAQAYAMSMNSQVHVNDLESAVKTAKEMLHGLPYDAEVAYALRYLKTYLDEAVDPAALILATEEHPILVEALKSGPVLKAAHGNAVIGVGELYASGMQLAFLQRYAGDERGAERTFADLDAAVAMSEVINAPDRQLMDAVRRQYGLLGHVLPEIEIRGMAQGISTGAVAKKFKGDKGFVTIVDVFPDYCPQCVKTMAGLAEFAAEHVAAKVHASGLVVREDMEAGPPGSWKELKGIATYAVKPEGVLALGAVDYPLFVVTNEHGLVYFVGNAPGNAFVPNGYMEQVIGRIVGELAVVRNGVGGKGKAVVKK